MSFEALGETWALRYSMDALCKLEEETGLTLGQIFAAAQQSGLSMRHLRAMFWAGLTDVSIAQAGAIIDEIGIAKAEALVGDAIAKAFPQETKAGNARAAKAKS